ncbi:MAG: hypothetical protein GWP19_15445 [Planctomycetia bacterium]|nr:hypothetical protein [Planctomycetia bacterium]
MEKSPIKKGTEVNLTIESLAFGGKGIAKMILLYSSRMPSTGKLYW